MNNTKPHSCLKNYFDHLVETFSTNFQISVSTFDEEAIHDLRVSLKKLRAYLRLMEHLHPRTFHWKEEFLPFKKVFKEVGVIRDVQVQMGLFTEFHHRQELQFRKYLHDLEFEAKIKLRQNLAHFDLKSIQPIQTKVHQSIGKVNSKTFEDKTLSFILERVTLTQDTYRNGNDPQAMHKSRILLKDAYYMLQMLVNCQEPPSPNQSLLEKVNSLQELFGDWHDWEVALAHFNAYLEVKQADIE